MTALFTHTTGLDLYAKPVDLSADPGSELASPWSSGIATVSEIQFGGSGTGLYRVNLVSRLEHVIYQQAGAEPASTDTPVGTIDAIKPPPLPVNPVFYAGQVIRWKVDFDEEVTDPQWEILVNGVQVATGTMTGTGTSFVAEVTVPPASTKGSTILARTIEAIPKIIATGVVYEAATTIAATAAVNVLPGRVNASERIHGTTLTAFVKETVQQSLSFYEADGTTPVDLSAKTLELVFELNGKDVAVIADGSLVRSGDDSNHLTFAYPEAVVKTPGRLLWSVRDVSSPRTVYAHGVLEVIYAAAKNSV